MTKTLNIKSVYTLSFRNCAHKIQTAHILILSFIVLLLIFIATYFSFKRTIKPSLIIAVFAIKTAASISYFIVYGGFYKQESHPSDAALYISDSETIINADLPASEVFRTICGFQHEHNLKHLSGELTKWYKPFNYGLPNDSRLIIRLCMIISLLSPSHPIFYYLIFSFLSTIGLIAAYAGFKKLRFRSSYIILFVPSILFWSSAPLKESISILLLGFAILCIGKKGLHNVLFFLLLLLCLSLNRLFLFIPALLFTLAHFISTKAKINATKYLLASICLCVILILTDFFFIKNGPTELLLQKQSDFFNMVEQLTPANSLVSLPDGTSFTGLFSLFSMSIINTLFRPFIWETNNLTSIVAGIENGALLLFFLFSIYIRIRKKIKLRHFEISILLFTLTTLILIGSTTPVLGALFRYRAPVLLVFLPVLANSFDVSNMLKKIIKIAR